MNVLTRDRLIDWLDRLADETTLIAPRTVDGIVLYRRVEYLALRAGTLEMW